jgi:hypothetical protein
MKITPFLGISIVSASVVFPIPGVYDIGFAGEVSSELDFSLAGTKQPQHEMFSRMSSYASGMVSRIAVHSRSRRGVAIIKISGGRTEDYGSVPSIDTDESYEISWSEDAINLSVKSLSGLVYGLETIHQLVFETGKLPGPRGLIKDAPEYKHRGLLVDIGRRFWPMPLLKQTIDAMPVAKLNVLHLHVSDNCRFGVESLSHPEINPQDGQFLTRDQITELIEYAASRAVRIVPEIDIPAHARGMREAFGVTWTDQLTHYQMTDSPGTRRFLMDILSEFAAVFPDEYFHFGSDETEQGDGGKALIEFAVQTLVELGKKPIGWEEAITNRILDDPSEFTVQVWNQANFEDLKKGGFKAIYSGLSTSYMDKRPTMSALWNGIGKAMSGMEELFFGGEMAMWGDAYCPIVQCYLDSLAPPIAGNLFSSEKDLEFAASINRMLWPKLILGGSALWNYSPSLQLHEAGLMAHYLKYLEKNFGIVGCVDTATCRCSEMATCDPNEPRPEAVVFPPVGPRTELSTTPVGLGIFAVQKESWYGSDSPINSFYMESNDWFSGDINLYLVGSYWSSRAFWNFEPVEDFVAEYRRASGNQDSTVWFVYDDADKRDRIIAREFVRQFVGWVRQVEAAGRRDRLGRIGISIEVGDIAASQIKRMITEEFNGKVRDDEKTKLEIILYEFQEPDVLRTAMRHANQIGILVKGNDKESILLSLKEYFTDKRIKVLSNPNFNTPIRFFVKAPIDDALGVARNVYHSLVDEGIISDGIRSRLVYKAGFLTVMNWETWTKQ